MHRRRCFIQTPARRSARRFLLSKETTGRGNTNLCESVESQFLCWQTQSKMGNRYQLYSNQAGNSLPFRHPRFVWLKHRRLQNQHPPKYQTGAGYDPHGNRKRRGHCRAATPQWPRLSICFSKLFCPNYAIRHYSVYVKTGEPIRQCYGRKFLFHSQIRMHSSFQAGDHPRSTNAHW